MNLGQLKEHIESFPEGELFHFNLSDPFSWRGSYDEVGFSIEETPATREELLEKINMALTEEFEGYKGGEYRYSKGTPVNFESEWGAYSDGGYTESWISKLLELDDVYRSPQHRLVGLLFKKNKG